MKTVKAGSVFFVVSLCLAVGRAQTASSAASPGRANSVEILLAEGHGYLTTGRYEAAASRFRLILARRSEVPEALFGLGIASSELGRIEEARQALERYVRLQPSDADGHCALGMVLLAGGRRSGAKAELQRALHLEPHNLEPAKALAHMATAENDGARAVALLKPLSTSPDFDDEARRLLAAGYAESKDDQAALSTLGSVLDRRPPPPPELFVLLVGSALRARDPAFAAHACDLGLRLYFNSDEIEQRCLGVVSMSFVNGLELTLHDAAEDVPTLVVMGRLLAEIAEVTDLATQERCIKLLERAVALALSDSGALYNLGRALQMLARPEEAIPTLEQALSEHPTDELQTLIWTQIGLAEQHLEQSTKAEDAFRRALQLNRRLSQHIAASAFNFYAFLVEANKEQQAAAVLDEILKWDPAFLPARMKHASALVKAGRLLEALEEAEFVALNADPANNALLRAAHLLLLQLCTRLARTERQSVSGRG